MKHKQILFFLLLVILTSSSYAALTCSLRSSCLTGETAIVKMSNDGTYDKHVATVAGDSGNDYNNVVCCSGAAGMGTNCAAAKYARVFYLDSPFNAHVWQAWPWTPTPTPVQVCISSTIDNVACAFVTDTSSSTGSAVCTANTFDTCFASISGDDGHIGDCSASRFPIVVCCTSTPGCDFKGDCDQDCIINVQEWSAMSTTYTRQQQHSCATVTYTPDGFTNQCTGDLKALPFNTYDATWRTKSTCGSVI